MRCEELGSYRARIEQPRLRHDLRPIVCVLAPQLRATERRLDWSERVSLEPELRAESEARGSLWWPSLDPTR